MNKQELIKELNNLGYKVEIKENIAMVVVPKYSERFTKTVKREIKKLGYNGSWGITSKNDVEEK